jgi:hypothetical protein
MVRAEPFEAGIDGLKDGLARQTGFVGATPCVDSRARLPFSSLYP